MTTLTRRQLTQAAGLLAVAGAAAWAPAARAIGARGLPPPDPLVQALNRLSFGILPADLERIRTLGLEAYLEEQLHPEQIDDSEVEEAIATHFPAVQMTIDELAALSFEAQRQAARQLVVATVYRALFSRRQLFEVMVDFWSNHFNIHQFEGPLRLLKIIDDREVVRAHALGNFRSLLHASATSPAMLYYLDNYNNTRFGPNENYARELLELHTLGVDGGYTEQDVLEVARCFTGWSIARRGEPDQGRFRFYPQLHDNGEKQVLGVPIPPGQGIGDGEQVLDLLAEHPATAQFIATKLCRRLAADEPPPSLIERVAAAYRNSAGDIPALLRALVLSPEFAAITDAKLKRPLEFLVSTLRASEAGLERRAALTVGEALQAMGQIPFQWPPPDGYPDTLAYWASTNGLLNRWNFAIALAEGTLPGIYLNLPALIGSARSPEALVDFLAERLLHRPLSTEDRMTLIAYTSGNLPSTMPLPETELAARVPGLVGLLLGSAYFQMR